VKNNYNREEIEMKKWMTLSAMFLALSWGLPGMAMEGHEGHDMSGSETTMEHSDTAGTFKHQAVVDGIRAEFQVMSLASMNMKDPQGATHHIMVKLFQDAMNLQIQNAVGKIKVISPSGKEQTVSLKNYNGIFAANFTFPEKGKYGVICLLKVDKQKHMFKFWYPHK